MAQKVQPQGLKSDGTLGTFRISDNNNLLVDFTPTSDDGLATAANQNTIIEDLETNGIKIKDIDSNVTITITKSIEKTFHDEAIVIGHGNDLECNGQYTTLVVFINRTNVSTNEIDFLGSNDGVNFFPLIGMKIGSDGDITSDVKSTGTTSAKWNIDVTGCKYVRMDLTTLTGTGATVTVKGVGVE